MTHEATIDKLVSMRLSAMADAYRQQIQDASLADLSFAERFGLLVEMEYRTRKNNRLKRLIQQATFEQTHAHIGGIDYTARRKLDRDQIEALATCEYIDRQHNIIIMSASGMGKTYLACAFGLAACQQFYSGVVRAAARTALGPRRRSRSGRLQASAPAVHQTEPAHP